MASPAFFSVYLDGILEELRKLNHGCRFGGVWMKEMLKVCETYATEHNLQFSVDPNPNKSKSKAIYMCGTDKNVVYPDNLQLNDHVLPWVQ